MEDLKNYGACSRLKGLLPLLEAWIQANEDYCRSHRHGDNPWWYNERTSLSTLAGAAWRLPGWTALEEFTTSKHRREMHRGPGLKKGRCDLFVAHGSRGFAIEAKQAWQSIGPNCDGGQTRIKHAMKGAWDDASCLSRDEADTRLALTFVVPFVPLKCVASGVLANGLADVDEPKVRGFVVDWLRGFSRYEEADARAHYFPKRVENYYPIEGRRLFPGVVLLLNERRRSLRKSAVPGQLKGVGRETELA